MTPEEPKSEKLYKAIKDIDAAKADNLVNKYEQVMAGIYDALTTSTNHGAKQAKVHIDNAAEGIIKNSGEFEKSSYEKDRAHLLDSFRQELDNVADYLGMNLQEKSPARGRLPKERPVGFAEPDKESDLQKTWDNLDSRQKAAVFNELSKSFVENLEISPVQQARWEQFNIIITALQTMKTEIDESRTKAEDWNQIWEYDETTHERAKDIDSLIANATRFGMKGILQEGLSVDQTLLKYNMEFGDALKDKLQHYDETKAFMDKYGKVKDITNEKDKIAYYVDLIKFMRDRKDYGTAQMLMEELMEKEFDQGREIIDPTKKTEIYDKAWSNVSKKITTDVLAQWRKEGMSTEQIEATRKEIIATDARKLENDYIAQNILIGDFGEAKSGIKSILLGAQHGPIWRQYKKMLDVKDEWLTVADKNWDYILDELIITAPLIILSGGVAGLAMKGIAAGARLAIAGTRLATVGVRLAEGGRLAKAAYSAGKLSVRATSLITEGALFELTHMGIQGKFLLNQEEWVKQVLWTAATLGVFKGAGKIGTRAGGVTQDLLKMAMPKLADKKLVALMNHLIVKGHFEVAGMLLIGATQHMAAGELDEFMDNFGEQLFHAYVSVGALNVVGGAVRVGGRTFLPGGGKPGGKGEGRLSRMKEREAKREAKEAADRSLNNAVTERINLAERAESPKPITAAELKSLAVKNPAMLEALIPKMKKVPLTLRELAELINSQKTSGNKLGALSVFNLLLKMEAPKRVATKKNIAEFVRLFTAKLPTGKLRNNVSERLSASLKPGSAIAGILILTHPRNAHAAVDLFWGAVTVDMPLSHFVPPLYLIGRLVGARFDRSPVDLFRRITDHALIREANAALEFAALNNTGRHPEARQVREGSPMHETLRTARSNMEINGSQRLRDLLPNNAMIGDYIARVSAMERGLAPEQAGLIRTYREGVQTAVNEFQAFVANPPNARLTEANLRPRISALQTAILGNIPQACRRTLINNPRTYMYLTDFAMIFVTLELLGAINFFPSPEEKKEQKDKEDQKKKLEEQEEKRKEREKEREKKREEREKEREDREKEREKKREERENPRRKRANKSNEEQEDPKQEDPKQEDPKQEDTSKPASRPGKKINWGLGE